MLNMIRRFWLKYCDLQTMIWNIAALMRVMLLNIDKRYTNDIPICNYVLWIMLSFAYFYVYLISVIWFVFVKCVETGDIIAAMLVVSYGIYSEIGISKLICMFWYKDVVRDLVESYLYYDSIVTRGSHFARNIQKTLRVVKKRALVYFVIMISNCIVYCATPLILPGRNLMGESFFIYGPKMIHESPNYEIVYCVITSAIIFSIYVPANITAFLIIIVGYTEAQMLALSVEVTQLWDDAERCNSKTNTGFGMQNLTASKKRLMNEYIERELTTIVKIHMINIKLIKKVETVFRVAIAVEFVLLTIGVITDLLRGLEESYMDIPFALLQVGIHCLIGQRLMDASIVFENAVYECKWENFNKANSKTVLLMLNNSQKTFTLSAGGIVMLNFATFMSVINSIYSTYTTLRSTIMTK